MRKVDVERGAGCAAILPAALIGFAGLADGAGPRGWRGFAEPVGLLVVCLAVTWLLAALLAWGARFGRAGQGLAGLAVLAVGMLDYRLFDWLGFDAPMPAKLAFTTSMQVLGTFGMVAALGGAALALWNGLRR